METLPQTKICTKCLKEKSLDQFWNQKSGKFGKNTKCIECLRKSKDNNYRVPPPSHAKKIEFVIETNGCYRCTSHINRTTGYPVIKKNYKPKLMSRFIYEECFGPIPEGMFIRHKCDNPVCINPEHLEIGTPQDNVRDMVERNRQAKGETSGRAKLTEKDVLDIKQMIAKGFTVRNVAKKYNVNVYTIYYIIQGKTWKHVKEGEQYGCN